MVAIAHIPQKSTQRIMKMGRRRRIAVGLELADRERQYAEVWAERQFQRRYPLAVFPQ